MKIALFIIALMLQIHISNSYAEELIIGNNGSGSAGISKKDKSFHDTKVEMNIDKIYMQIKSGNLENIELIFLGAKKGYANACLYVAYMFENGIGVARSSDKAFIWLKTCANKNAYAAYNLGVLYAEGRGTPVDKDQALKYFKMSWPDLKTIVPQIAIRIAYHHFEKKEWNEAWKWGNRVETIVNNKKHGSFITSYMIANKIEPAIGGLNVALFKAHASMNAFNPNAAELIGWIYGTGKTDKGNSDEAKEVACSYDFISNKMGGKVQVTRYCGSLDLNTRAKAEDFAKKYMMRQKTPKLMDFKKLLDGKEGIPQLKFINKNEY